MTLGPDGNLWFVEAQTNMIGVFSPVTTNLLHEYSVPFVLNFRQFYNIITGPDGNLWYTDTGGGRICAINPANGAVAVFPLATNCQPFDIVVGPDNAIWFTEFISSKIGRLTTDCFNAGSFTTDLSVSPNINTNALSEFIVPTNHEDSISLTNAEPYGMAVVTNGTNVNIWFSEYAGSSIDRIDTITTTNGPTNIITRVPTRSLAARPSFLVSGGDTNIWFGETAINAISKLVLDHFLIFNAANIAISGTTFSGVLATFKDSPTNSYATNYVTSIDWGDGNINHFNTNTSPTNFNINISTKQDARSASG